MTTKCPVHGVEHKGLICKMTLDVAQHETSGGWWVLKRVWGGESLRKLTEVPHFRHAWGPFVSKELAEQVSRLIAPGESEHWQAHLQVIMGKEAVQHVGNFSGKTSLEELELEVEASKVRMAGGVVEEVV